jgi:uncharacterized membrane protein
LFAAVTRRLQPDVVRRVLPMGLAGLPFILAAILVVAGIVHIASVLLLPRLAPDDAFAHMARLTAADEGIIPLKQAIAPDDQTPFRDPAVASAICRYDLAKGPMRVTVPVEDGVFIALSIFDRYGTPFYGLTDRAANEGKLDLLRLTAAELEHVENAATGDEPVRDVRVVSPNAQGFVKFDALARVGGYAPAEQALASIRCQVERDF